MILRARLVHGQPQKLSPVHTGHHSDDTRTPTDLLCVVLAETGGSANGSVAPGAAANMVGCPPSHEAGGATILPAATGWLHAQSSLDQEEQSRGLPESGGTTGCGH